MSINNPDGDLLVCQVSIEDKLSKIRAHSNSKLENQKNLAVILAAVEENIAEQNNEKTPVAYFVSFLSLLDQAIKEDKIIDTDIATTAAYFIDLVFPSTPKPLLQSKFADILVKLAVPLTSSESGAPIVRSTIGALESLLLAQNYQQWSISGNVSPKRAFVGLLELAYDARPKIRKRAQEAIQSILLHPPTSPSPHHVASTLAGELALEKLVKLLEIGKDRKHSNDNSSQKIHALQVVTAICSANAWPEELVEQLCDILLDVSRTSDQYLVSSAFSAFEGLFKSMANVIDVDRFTRVLNILLELKPSINDGHLAASWLAVIARNVESFSFLSPESCVKKIPDFFKVISQFLASSSKDIYYSASQCLIAIITQAIPEKFLLLPNKEHGITPEIYELMDDTTSFLGSYMETELLSIKYQHATKDILELLSACISKLRFRANPDFLGPLKVVGEWRTKEAENFPYNIESEEVIATSSSSLGAEVVLRVLPLNLGDTEKTGRAWLLPLLRDNVRFSELHLYRSEILPLVGFYEEKIKSSRKQSLHNKIFETLIDQIWSLLPHFCDLPKDLRVDFDSFGAKLSDLLYSKIELRTPICNALKNLVESNLAYSKGAMSDDLLMLQEFSIAESEKNLSFLSERASNILSVLFNVFASTRSESRGLILETIDVYLQIVPGKDLEVTFDKVCGLLKSSMDGAPQTDKKDDMPPMSVTMLDLVVAMTRYLPSSMYNALFSIFSATVASPNLLFQKRAYRILTKLGESEAGSDAIKNYLNEVISVILSTSESTNNSARASRLCAVMVVLQILPASHLYFIPAVLQEIIMCTKEVNEKSRSLAFANLVKMGKIMANGGEIDNSKVPGFGEDSGTSQASIIEYFTIVSAGLAAQAPHMISATITALSCLVFEFKDVLPVDVLLEISSTVELFLTHNSREIAKAAIGFVKVEILSLPDEMVQANLKEMLEKLMRWSHEHKGHFKSKVKHILERLIRRFGSELIEESIPEEDRKLILNIKKVRNRSKRQQAVEKETRGPRKFVSAYEEALYSSDSESELEEVNENSKNKPKTDKFILNTSDPLNLLDLEARASISSSRPRSVNKKNIKSMTSELRNADGKFVFEENREDPLAKESGIDAYIDAVRQAPVRGQKNKLKFKKSKDYDADGYDESSGEEETPRPSRPSKITSKHSKVNRIQKKSSNFKSRRKL